MITDFTRYSKNLGAFTREEIEAVHAKSVCIAGCGGLGGFAAMSLARFGVGKLTLIDGDLFTVSNLNRQLFCTETNLGQNKAIEAKKALSVINSDIEVTAYPQMLNEDNCGSLLSGHDIVLDCLDNVPARILLEKTCKEAEIPLIHGAINGFLGQVCCILPGDDIIRTLYAGNISESFGNTGGNPPFTPQLVAAIQCSEALKVLTGRENILRKKLLLIDLQDNTFQTVEL